MALAEQYAALLADAGVERGLIGPREVPRLWDRHVLNSAAVSTWIPEGARVCDIGSGAGLPGLVLALARPDVQVTLVEPLLRRTTFLDEAVALLGLTEQVEVVRARADALHGERLFDVVTSRAVAPLERLLGWSMPLVAPHGALVAMKGSSVADEVERSRGVLHGWGCAEPEIGRLGAGVLEEPTWVLRVAWADPSSVSWPPAPGTSAGRASRNGGRRPGPRSGRRRPQA
ncbi:Ribosomal RNA small subunit methyltransferase G [Nocardioides dokdonensis FR1436]|uniref:Ribosomal RNA small subunit methyltransferase G n=2 Tax=Nocardioides TaxID=1839 RepID=A0A1A9GHB0_9ACTN|nr:16S rRNA (guanine(527)-N(7))-methyltransferase RsmG [Nocardioides dokdonensis]ANH37709.1 Ribosomal RNA small subunit methyltransferase G [Nocardioides dokdonensis FR1436]